MLYNALLVGKKTPKTAHSPWDFIIVPEDDQATATCNMHRKIGKIMCVILDHILADRQTYTHRQTNRRAHHNISPLLPRAK